MRRYLILTPEVFITNGKTAHGVIKYSSDETVAVIDPSMAGRTVRDVMPHLDCDAPIVASVEDGLRYRPTALLIGTAPIGGALPPSWRLAVLSAIHARLEIVSGLHELLGDDRELADAATIAGTTIWDVRDSPPGPLFSGVVYGVEAPVLLTVGNDCAVGKMTTSLEFVRAARARGHEATFVPTGQTGIMIAGWGVAVDRVIADFAAGAAEQLVLQAARCDPDVIVVEGQGAINHPAYASVTMALLFGTAPDGLLLVCDPKLRTMYGYGTPVLPYTELIATYERICAGVKPAAVLGIALNTHGMSEAEAAFEINRAREETGLPADDVVRHGAADLYDRVTARLAKREPLTASMRAAKGISCGG